MSEPLKPARRLTTEREDQGWSAKDVLPEEYVDDAWIAENTKEVTDGVYEGTDSPDS